MNKSEILVAFIKVISNIIFIHYLCSSTILREKVLYHRFVFILIGINFAIEILFFNQPVVAFVFRLLIILFYLVIMTKQQLLTLFSMVLFSFIITDILQIVAAFFTFPIFKANTEKINFKTASTISMCILVILTILVCKLLLNKIEKFFISNTRRVKVGICIISGFLEGIFILLRRQEYEKKNDSLYIMMLLFIGFSSTILFFWIWDKMEEQKKIRELTSYAHKTSEVIPTIHRIIKDNDLFEDNEKMVMLMKELQSVCESDSKEVQQDCKSMKTFAPTGCMMLDKQLQRYLEEAEMEQFHLDIIVQAPVKKILQEQMIDVKGLIQVVGDLYKNAKKSIKVEKSRQNILICFGYLTKNCYQISVFDTGIPFPEQVLKNFGTRGITTNGTGNGLADIRKTLENGRASIIVSHDVPAGNTFTKEVSVVFDGMYDIEIK